jgi:ankyrin repeat protein
LSILSIVQWLLDDEGADVNTKDARDESPLVWLNQSPQGPHVKLSSQRIGIVKGLIEAGADLPAIDRIYNLTTFHWSAWSKKYQVAKMLIAAS